MSDLYKYAFVCFVTVFFENILLEMGIWLFLSRSRAASWIRSILAIVVALGVYGTYTYCIQPLPVNRSSIAVDPQVGLYIVGTAELVHPFDDPQGLAQFEADVWYSQAFLADYLPYVTQACIRIYGNETSINLATAQYHFRTGGADPFIVQKSGILVGVDSIEKSRALAQNMTRDFQHARFGKIAFVAKPLPTNLPVLHERLEFSEAGLVEAATTANVDFIFQAVREWVRRGLLGIDTKEYREFNLILYATTVNSAKTEFWGDSIDVFFFRDD